MLEISNQLLSWCAKHEDGFISAQTKRSSPLLSREHAKRANVRFCHSHKAWSQCQPSSHCCSSRKQHVRLASAWTECIMHCVVNNASRFGSNPPAVMQLYYVPRCVLHPKSWSPTLPGTAIILRPATECITLCLSTDCTTHRSQRTFVLVLSLLLVWQFRIHCVGVCVIQLVGTTGFDVTWKRSHFVQL